MFKLLVILFVIKVRGFEGSIKTNFLGNNVPKENTYFTILLLILF